MAAVEPDDCHARAEEIAAGYGNTWKRAPQVPSKRSMMAASAWEGVYGSLSYNSGVLGSFLLDGQIVSASWNI